METFPTGPLGYPLMFRLRQNAFRAALCPTDMVDAGMSGVSRADWSPTQNSSTQIYTYTPQAGIAGVTRLYILGLCFAATQGTGGVLIGGYKQTGGRQ